MSTYQDYMTKVAQQLQEKQQYQNSSQQQYQNGFQQQYQNPSQQGYQNRSQQQYQNPSQQGYQNRFQQEYQNPSQQQSMSYGPLNQHQTQQYQILPPQNVMSTQPSNQQRTQTQMQISDSLTKHLRAYSAAPLERIKIRPEFANPLQFQTPETTHEFSDRRFLDQPSVLLRKLTIDEIISWGRYIVPMLTSGFSKCGAAAIFQLAYNLKYRSAGKLEHVFDEPDVENQPSDFTLASFGEIVLGNFGQYNELNTTGLSGDEMEAAYYCYLCASLLRLFTKSHDNYVRAWPHINMGFIRFYASRVPVSLRPPNEDVILSLQSYWEMEKRFLFSLYKILYASSQDDNSAELRRFLYETHLSLTGLHVVGIFIRLMLTLNCKSTVLLSALYSPEYARELHGINAMLKLSLSENPEHERKMWTYGRLFDETFFSEIQTKRCFKLAFSLAIALKIEAPHENEGILNIKVFEKAGEAMRAKCTPLADNLLRTVKRFIAQPSFCSSD